MDTDTQARFPHCDAEVLHAPGECGYCDLYPEAQQARVKNNVNFTGHHDPGKTTCPAEARRGMQSINSWHGNVAIKDPDSYWKKWTEEMKKALGDLVGKGQAFVPFWKRKK